MTAAQGGRRPFRDDPPGRDDRDPVSEELSLVHVVSCQEHCLAQGG
jgi:hypothetical protein